MSLEVNRVGPMLGSLTDRSGTVTTGGTAQTLMSANGNRKYLFIQNASGDDFWVNFTTTAVAGRPSILIRPGEVREMTGSFVTTELVSIMGTYNGQEFTAKEG